MTATLSDKALYQATRQHWQQGRKAEAITLCRQLNQQAPGFAPGWLLASEIALTRRQASNALALAERALKLAPSTEAELQQVRCLRALNRYQAARQQLAQQGMLTDLNLGSERAWLFSELGCPNAAAKQYRYLLQHHPDAAHLHFNLATVLRHLGQLEEAEQALDRTIALQPEDDDAWQLRSSLRKQKPDRHHLTELTEAISQRQRPCPALHFAKAKELEDLERYDEAFTSLQTGAGQRRAEIQYQVEQDLAIIQAIRQLPTPALKTDFNAHSEEPGPIFVLGLPRTGSTLVERMLGSHPECYAAGELNDFAQCLSRLTLAQAQQQGVRVSNQLELVHQSASIDMAQLGQHYLASLPPEAQQARCFTDKMPLNFLYIGWLLQALPNARIVHIQRHPMATCYAIYKQWFDRAYPFSYDQQELAQYYHGYRQLMAHWQQHYGERIHSVQYETLLEAPEATCRALLSHCGLDWDPAVLAFHRQTQASTTASASQVRQPLYQSSKAQWQHYRQQLAPLAKRLTEMGYL
ncbi:tetratricopeptide repeat-containing sulfotransferase family protein [Ferrimonas marina]|uniref:Tetratricopeptide repeat-containing protein n=1 Tax=Ferrimonas marina TaxID=299255 RepID=A0A1M5X8Q7_9GAMM|nr:sulfotransferase [Ferrimonas marina]SHH95593.1 Tetratricopeptide repeat-containing protein [Ferrimonas marina]